MHDALGIQNYAWNIIEFYKRCINIYAIFSIQPALEKSSNRRDKLNEFKSYRIISISFTSNTIYVQTCRAEWKFQ